MWIGFVCLRVVTAGPRLGPLGMTPPPANAENDARPPKPPTWLGNLAACSIAGT
jgi:hypothetical protein